MPLRWLWALLGSALPAPPGQTPAAPAHRRMPPKQRLLSTSAQRLPGLPAPQDARGSRAGPHRAQDGRRLSRLRFPRGAGRDAGAGPRPPRPDDQRDGAGRRRADRRPLRRPARYRSQGAAPRVARLRRRPGAHPAPGPLRCALCRLHRRTRNRRADARDGRRRRGGRAGARARLAGAVARADGEAAVAHAGGAARRRRAAEAAARGTGAVRRAAARGAPPGGRHRHPPADGAGHVRAAGREGSHPVRQLAVHRHLDLAGRRDAAGGGVPRVHRDVRIPAEHPLHADPDARRADRAAGQLRHAARFRLLHQRADDVRHGAGDRHRRGRRHRRRRKRGTDHERGGLVALQGHEEGDGPDLGRHHRRDRGADLGVRAAGFLQRLDRQHLPPVLGGDGQLHRVLGVHGAVVHAGAVRHAAQARRGRPPPGEARLLRLVQPRLQPHGQGLRELGQAHHSSRGPRSHRLRRRHRRGRADVPEAADVLRSERGPGQHPRQRATAARRHAGAHAGRDEAGRGVHAQAARGGEHGRRRRLQLRRFGPERGPRLRHAQALGRTPRCRALGAGPGGALLPGAGQDPRCGHLPDQSPTHP
ncbi:unnamed protein product [Rotaria sp. Silwood1]|nr:unnamed protein product [Rotaria sp. Silwood1]